MQALGWIDLAFIGVLVLSAIVGLWRGVVYEVLSLAGWLVAWLCAQAWGHEVALAWLPSGWSIGMSRTVGYAVLFVGTLVVWRVLVWLIQQALHASPVAPVDRALGAGFGALRGVLIVLALVMLVGLTPIAAQPLWRASAAVQWAQWGLAVLAPLLPGEGWLNGLGQPSRGVPTAGRSGWRWA